jgi:hypothetical protein
MLISTVLALSIDFRRRPFFAALSQQTATAIFLDKAPPGAFGKVNINLTLR